MNVKDDFLSLLGKRLEDKSIKCINSDCLVWNGCIYNRSPPYYGRIEAKLPSESISKTYLVHRVALMCYMKSELNPSESVSHLCNRSWCVKPEHLNIEPHSTNMDRKTCFQFGECRGLGTEPASLFGNYRNATSFTKLLLFI
ncbi:hypothetical protein DPMN_054156 [Dreissena polymorpha]|uniref:Zinc-binding loop region of homing endonuclease domain-containing protein n=1 Tax=Dreissena polymorpha TaxID=45954 RepID=A0A9D4CMP0_DREPO|nr:hypothetical protein DPMN_054148 [Dreissena polymorpha]KAH3728201.1 hypothetical protein DPMN_054152 [Dreissena polymorpha]KAH3728205.1 hypothetical protein DPMN_054156 [Dreissena polymorpha]